MLYWNIQYMETRSSDLFFFILFIYFFTLKESILALFLWICMQFWSFIASYMQDSKDAETLICFQMPKPDPAGQTTSAIKVCLWHHKAWLTVGLKSPTDPHQLAMKRNKARKLQDCSSCGPPSTSFKWSS